MKVPHFLLLILACVVSCIQIGCSHGSTHNEHNLKKRKIISTPGLVAFWDFKQAEKGVWKSTGEKDTFPLYLRRIGDNHEYTRSTWPYSDEQSKIMIDETGPFGNAIHFNQGYIYGAVPRQAFENTALNIRDQQAFTLIAWVKFIGKRHLVAGIWDEGGWHKYAGRRQYALFAGLFNQDGVIAHLSSTGAASYPQSEINGAQYARIRAVDSMPFNDNEWVAMAMSYNPADKKIRAYLNGKMTKYHLDDPVVQNVYEYPEKQLANPLSFSGPIFSPQLFILKFNGYNFHQGGIYEHRLLVDLKNRKLMYQAEGDTLQMGKNKFRIRFDIIRNDTSILLNPLIFMASQGVENTINIATPISFQDTVTASLEMNLEAGWIQVGTTLKHVVQPGAPFTVGRALGLASEEIEHGSQLYVDGVAVFNRMLNEQELLELSFSD
jgi:hypothetical protein